jgi:hypothetical protein
MSIILVRFKEYRRYIMKYYALMKNANMTGSVYPSPIKLEDENLFFVLTWLGYGHAYGPYNTKKAALEVISYHGYIAMA